VTYFDLTWVVYLNYDVISIDMPASSMPECSKLPLYHVWKCSWPPVVHSLTLLFVGAALALLKVGNLLNKTCESVNDSLVTSIVDSSEVERGLT